MSKTNSDAAADRDLYSGLIRLHVLHHAVEQPVFGLGMIEELARHGYRISPGSLYPLLRGLERKGYLRSTERRNGRSLRRVYRATEAAPAPLNVAAAPAAVEQNAVIEQARAQLRRLERSYFPRFYLQGAAYARGSGAEINGDRLGGLNGLAPNYQNYALGFTVSFPITDLPSLRAREAEQSANIRSQSARAEQITVDLRAQWNRAVAALAGARNVAANTPTEVSAASAALRQATARYQSGLGVIDDVAEAQRLLTQAEIEDALARLSVWRALLAIAAAAGDLQPFLAEAAQ